MKKGSRISHIVLKKRDYTGWIHVNSIFKSMWSDTGVFLTWLRIKTNKQTKISNITVDPHCQWASAMQVKNVAKNTLFFFFFPKTCHLIQKYTIVPESRHLESPSTDSSSLRSVQSICKHGIDNRIKHSHTKLH